jgi:putative membrane protein
VRLRRAARTAREQFLAQGVHNTQDRCGILIFVSVGEHYVEILADRAINEKVEQAEWDAIVADFVQAVKKGEVAAGFEQAVAACGKLLETNFPATPGDRNELPDHLIEI